MSMLMLMRQAKMDPSSTSSSSRHLRTHLFFSEFDRHSENNYNEMTNRNSSFRRRNYNNVDDNVANGSGGTPSNNNNNCIDSGYQSSALSDRDRSAATSNTSKNRRGGPGGGTGTWTDESSSSRDSRFPDDLFVVDDKVAVDHNVENNNNRARSAHSPHPFIQISCPPRPTDNQTADGRSTRTPSWRSSGGGSVTSSPQSSSQSTRTTPPVPGRHGGCYLSTPSNLRKALTNGKIEQVQEDCFIIPAHRMGTFLPISIQFDAEKQMGSLSMMHVDDPKLCIILHFAEPSSSLNLQLAALKGSLARVKSDGNASEGMLLMNMERSAAYPFIVYLVINTAQIPPCAFLQSYNSIVVDELQPDQFSNGTGTNYISGYEEVATIARPPIGIGPKISSNPKTGYLITIFKVFPGDDREKLERSWLLWTGARTIYKHLPQNLGLRRITFHKKLWPDGGITYILMCECTNLLEHITIAFSFVEQLRARCCGYTALYKSVEKF